jgi:hypothetical protein
VNRNDRAIRGAATTGTVVRRFAVRATSAMNSAGARAKTPTTDVTSGATAIRNRGNSNRGIVSNSLNTARLARIKRSPRWNNANRVSAPRRALARRVAAVVADAAVATGKQNTTKAQAHRPVAISLPGCKPKADNIRLASRSQRRSRLRGKSLIRLQ